MTTRTLATVAVVLLILVAAIGLLYIARAAATPSSAVPTPLTTATHLVAPSPSQNLPTSTPVSPTPTPIEQESFTNPKYRYSIVLVRPYHLSPALTTTFNGAHPAAQDLFTVQAPEQEAAGSKNCETACPVWDYTLLVDL